MTYLLSLSCITFGCLSIFISKQHVNPDLPQLNILYYLYDNKYFSVTRLRLNCIPRIIAWLSFLCPFSFVFLAYWGSFLFVVHKNDNLKSSPPNLSHILSVEKSQWLEHVAVLHKNSLCLASSANCMWSWYFEHNGKSAVKDHWQYDLRNTAHSCNRYGVTATRPTSERPCNVITCFKNIYCVCNILEAPITADVSGRQ